MAKILRIDSSSRQQNSHSREIADFFQTIWLKKYPNDEVIVRDIVQTEIPHISDVTIAGYYTPKEQHSEQMKLATSLSDALIDELLSVDVLLLSVPMYNFSVPSVLKAWIDQIVRIGKTFSYDGKSFNGLVTGKRAYVICAYGAGGYTQNGQMAVFNFLEPYLKLLLNFLGILDVHFFAIEATTGDEATVITNKELVRKEIEKAITAS
ncbi:FMN-dependent NADH-azoreductase [Calothrix sp. HK-06]|nr:FMN-dependent NADH-azoreductase [Calothrix sp. HK-06]